MSDVASALHVTPQTIRNWIDAGKLDGFKRGSRWRVTRASFEQLRGKAPESDTPTAPPGDSVELQLDRLTRAVEELAAHDSSARQLVDAISRERDRYRAEAATAREAALRVNAAARDMDVAVRRLLAVLESQADALAQLLAPGSPQDLHGGG